MTTWITICDSCKKADWQDRNAEETDGAVFAARVEAAAKDVPGVQTRRHSCLMGCAGACNVAVQGSAGKLAYTLGRFDGSPEEAEAVVEYARLHSQSETGQVPFKQWPAPIKGHFVTRHPPLPGQDG